MNRYELEGLTFDLINSLNVIICARRTHARLIFNDVLERLQEDGFTPDRISRVNGQERIEINGGRLTFAHTADTLRGFTADLILFSKAITELPSFPDEWGTNAAIAAMNSSITADQPRHRLRRSIEQLSG